MTRKEEIQNYAYNNCINDDIDDTSYSLIVEAAKWADETMIAKACDWLTKHLYDYDHIEGYEVFRDVNSFVKDFRKAMLHE